MASSSTRIGGSLYSARATAMRWRWPPERRVPASPITVSKPPGNSRMNSSANAARAHARSRSRSTVLCPYAMLAATVVLNSTVSWVTRPMLPRSDASVRSRMSVPSIAIRPACTSQNRGSSCATVDFPAPEAPTRASARPAGITRSRPRRTGLSGS